MDRPRWMQPAVPPELAAVGFERYDEKAFRADPAKKVHVIWSCHLDCEPRYQRHDMGRLTLIRYCEEHARAYAERE